MIALTVLISSYLFLSTIFFFTLLSVSIFIFRFFLNKKTKIDTNKKAILITGAANGLGYQLAKKCLESGCYVFACDIEEKTLKTRFKDDPNCTIIKLDVTNIDDIEKAYQIVEKTVQDPKNHIFKNKLFGLVNNAGIARHPKTKIIKPMIEFDEEEMHMMFGVNVFGAIRMTKKFFSLISRNKEQVQESGCIVNVASIAGIIAVPYANFYCATKHAMVGYSESLRLEMKAVGVRVTCICPFFANTRIIKIPPVDEKSIFYSDMNKRVGQVHERFGNFILPVEKVTDVMFDGLFTHETYPLQSHWISPNPLINVTFKVCQFLNMGLPMGSLRRSEKVEQTDKLKVN